MFIEYQGGNTFHSRFFRFGEPKKEIDRIAQMRKFESMEDIAYWQDFGDPTCYYAIHKLAPMFDITIVNEQHVIRNNCTYSTIYISAFGTVVRGNDMDTDMYQSKCMALRNAIVKAIGKSFLREINYTQKSRTSQGMDER